MGYNSSRRAGPGWRDSSHPATPDRLIPSSSLTACALPFSGNHDHSLDAKNRLTVPAKARAQLSGGVSLTKGFDKCLQVWPAQDYEQLTQQALSGLNPFAPETRELKRHFFGNTIQTELDSAGRIMLPPDFMAYAGISKEVRVVGAMDCLELWDRSAWTSHDTDLIARAADHIANVGNPA